MYVVDTYHPARSFAAQSATAYRTLIASAPEVADLVAEFPDMMQAGNARMMAHLGHLIAVKVEDIPAAVRSYMIAALRERHMTMPTGREISPALQSYLERALIQARLHLMSTPGAAQGFTVAADQYAAEFENRRNEAARHLANLPYYGVSSWGATEWCERLVTKFTPEELARPELKVYAQELSLIASRLHDFDETVGAILKVAIDFLAMGESVTVNAADAVKQKLPGFVLTTPETYQDAMNAMPLMKHARRARL